MDDIFILTLICSSIAFAVVMTILFYIYYNRYRSQRDDKTKWVVLRDFEGHIKRLGRFAGFGLKNKQFTVRVLSLGEKFIREWVIRMNPRYTFDNVSREYRGDNYWELTIFAVWDEALLEQGIVEPLIHESIIELGLTQGLKAIDEKVNPLFLRIKNLEDDLKKREAEIVRLISEGGEQRLVFLQQAKIAFKELLDRVGNEYISAPQLLTRKIKQDQAKYGLGKDQSAESPPEEGEKAKIASREVSAEPVTQEDSSPDDDISKKGYPHKVRENSR